MRVWNAGGVKAEQNVEADWRNHKRQTQGYRFVGIPAKVNFINEIGLDELFFISLHLISILCLKMIYKGYVTSHKSALIGNYCYPPKW